MEKLIILSQAVLGVYTVSKRKHQRICLLTCTIFLASLFLLFSQNITGQIPLKSNQQAISPQQDNTITREFNLRGSDREIIEFELSNPGVIEAKANWNGTAKELALILNGPGRAQYCAREDGSSNLTLTYKVTANILEMGKTWRISVVNFRQGTIAHGKVKITYPGPSVHEEFKEPGVVRDEQPQIKPVEQDKFLIVSQYEIQESKGFTARELHVITAELEAQKIEHTKAKIETRIREIGPDNPLVQIVVPLIYKNLEEQTNRTENRQTSVR